MIACSHCGERPIAYDLGVEHSPAVTSDGGVDGLYLNQSVQSIAPTGGIGAITTFLYLLHANHVGCKPVEPCNHFVSPLGPPGLEKRASVQLDHSQR